MSHRVQCALAWVSWGGAALLVWAAMWHSGEFRTAHVGWFLLLLWPLLERAWSARQRQRLLAQERDMAQTHDEPQTVLTARQQLLVSLNQALNEPLLAMQAHSAALLQEVRSPQAQPLLQHTQDAIDHLRAILHNAQDHAQWQTGELRLQWQTLALAPVVTQAFDMLAPRARIRGLDYTQHLDADVPTHIHTDPHRLKQVLVNLLSNAIKFTTVGSVRLNVQVQNHGLLFVVQDTGVGIAEEKQGHLFQPFEQADATVQGRYGGYGLGLSICAQIVQALGGQIGFSSALGQGSRFWFWLPLSRVTPPGRNT